MLRSLTAQAFRNLAEVHLEAHPRFNILEGENGQGKTNVLEAVYLLATLRSFRDARAGQMIAHGEAKATVGAAVMRRDLARKLGVELTSRGKRVALDGRVVARASDYLGNLSVVAFGPEDLALTKGGPAERRRFLDRAIFGVWPAYLDEARAYVDALKQRNAILRQASQAGRAPDAVLLGAYDDAVVRHGARLVARRLAYVAGFEPRLVGILSDISDGALDVDLRYGPSELDALVQGAVQPVAAGRDGAGPASALEATEVVVQGFLRERLERSHDTDVRRGFTGTGPHLDDLRVRLGGRPARAYASQGQHRATALALKIAELETAHEVKGLRPVLLLDDVSSELDRVRNAKLVEYLDDRGGQVFVTTTDRRWIQVSADTRVFRVAAGRVSSDG